MILILTTLVDYFVNTEHFIHFSHWASTLFNLITQGKKIQFPLAEIHFSKDNITTIINQWFCLFQTLHISQNGFMSPCLGDIQMLNICDVDVFDQNLSSADFNIDTQCNIILLMDLHFQFSSNNVNRCNHKRNFKSTYILIWKAYLQKLNHICTSYWN